MEAARFGFVSAAPAFKFDPTDDDIVAHYLLPRALGVRDPPFAHAVIEDDTASLPPPDLLARHGHGTSHHAFFVDTIDMAKNGGRRERVIKGGDGGLWRGQQGQFLTLTLLSPGGHEVDIKYKRYDLTYKRFDEEEESKGKKRKRENGNGGTPSGWVMHEYTIITPEQLQTTVLSRIKLTKSKIKDDQRQADAEAKQLDAADLDQHQQVFPAHEQPQPGPSYCHNFPYQQQAGPSHHHDFPYQEQAGPSYCHDLPYQQQAGPSSYQDFPMLEQPGPSYYHQPLHMTCGGAGFSDGSQAVDASCYGEDFPCQQQAGPNCQDFPTPEQQGTSSFQHPLDMMSGGAGFSDGSQAVDASCYGYGEDFPCQQQAGPSCQDFSMPEQPVLSYYHHPPDMTCGGGGGQGLSYGSQADDASCYGDNGGFMGGGFVDLLNSEEGFAGDNTYFDNNLYCDGFNFSGAGIDIEPHSATGDTCLSNDRDKSKI